jgi:hypothetical protein
MKIAYLIMAHTDAIQCHRLVKSLYVNKDKTRFYVHIDKKTDITPFLNLLGHLDYVKFLEDRIFVQWAGYSLIKCMLALLECAVKDKCDNYMFLSGMDYPLLSNDKILTLLEENMERNFIMAKKYDGDRCNQYFFFRDTKIKNRKVKRLFTGVAQVAMKFLPFRKPPYIIVNGKKYYVYLGGQMFCLNKNCAEYVLMICKTHNEFEKYFKTSWGPDEMFFHTIVFNSPFANSAILAHNGNFMSDLTPLHYLENVKAKTRQISGGLLSSVMVFNENDFHKLLDSQKPFARKFVSGYSDKVMNLIDIHRESK